MVTIAGAATREADVCVVGAGLAGFILALTPLPIWVPILPMIPAAIWPVVFSYLRYKELERNGELPEQNSAPA